MNYFNYNLNNESKLIIPNNYFILYTCFFFKLTEVYDNFFHQMIEMVTILE